MSFSIFNMPKILMRGRRCAIESITRAALRSKAPCRLIHHQLKMHLQVINTYSADMALTAVTIFVISAKILIQLCGFCPGRYNPAILRVSSQPNTTSGKYLSFIPFFPSPSYNSQLLLHPALCLDQILLNCPAFPSSFIHLTNSRGGQPIPHSIQLPT
ncbi:hypothetical protein J3E69DRAFT_333736 [Trichoderma sp. SZMC 28015]